MAKKCLVLVDIQNDFLEGGNLAVPHANEVISIANQMIDSFDFVISTQDWHPANHGSFASQHPGKNPGELIELYGLQQVLWPDHCVQGSFGAEFHKDLNTNKIEKIFPKGQDKTVDSYSGFFDNGKKLATGMGEYLQAQSVTDIYVMGLALDYCVKFTAVDAKDLDLNVHLLLDGCRAVNLQAGDDEKAVKEMQSYGIRILRSTEV
ncbi:MAG: bifunctional nicotinamidase/pyrazinamidase [Spirochaetota bacterium]